MPSPLYTIRPGGARLRLDPNTVVMQPHTLCPLDCDYCDLPLRRQNIRMYPVVAEAVAATVNMWTARAEQEGTRQPDVLWHSSEPLALGVKHLAGLYEPFDVDVRHTMQTAGIHINEEWIEFFKATRTDVGISLDGPEHMNVHRKMLGGQPAYARAMRGVGLMHKHDLPFAIIAVVRDPHPDMVPELMRFFAQEVRPRSLAINIEETQGTKTAQDLDFTTVVRFWEQVFRESDKYPDMPIRDIERVMDWIGRVRMPAWDTKFDVMSRDPYPTVRWDGNVVLVAPELVDWTPDGREQWTSGNVLDVPLHTLIQQAVDRTGTPWIDDFLTSVNNCADTCPVFGICRGGQPSNRVFEGLPLTATRTRTCTNDRIALMEGAMRVLSNA